MQEHTLNKRLKPLSYPCFLSKESQRGSLTSGIAQNCLNAPLEVTDLGILRIGYFIGHDHNREGEFGLLLSNDLLSDYTLKALNIN